MLAALIGVACGGGAAVAGTLAEELSAARAQKKPKPQASPSSTRTTARTPARVPAMDAKPVPGPAAEIQAAPVPWVAPEPEATPVSPAAPETDIEPVRQALPETKAKPAAERPHQATSDTDTAREAASRPAADTRRNAETSPDEAAPSTLSAQEILRRADEVRNPQIDYTVRVMVTSKKPNGSNRVHVYEVMVSGRDKATVKTIKPSIDKGRVLLMREKDLWAFLPSVSKPLRVSFRERLIGEVANGDLARTNFTGDYTPTIAGTERQDGRDCWKLDLHATADDVTYARVVLWVERTTFHPRRAEFYAVSGRLLKMCSYARYVEMGGRLRPTQLLMNDATVTGQYSILDYDSMVVAPLPEKYFTKDYLKRLVTR
jgi:outer membrane lipoprotein-sorting protein